jgi:predicted nuclease with RNAse H fold
VPRSPSTLPSNGKISFKANRNHKKIIKEGLDIIETHSASIRKALKMPTKNWQKIQEVPISMDLEEDLKTRTLMPYETDALMPSPTMKNMATRRQ